MLTLLKNIERFNKRYNKKRGSAMLMVLMTMAIIIVVGTSMLFVTLSSFSNSIADTQQERAYNAALVMTETLKSSSYLGKLIESNSFELEQDNPVKLQFDNGDLDDELDDFTIINGVKVYVTFTNASKEKTSLDSVLVDVRGVKGSQESTVSFTYNKETTVKNVTLKDTFGNALVTNNSLGGEKKRDDLVFKRIEGDISINCWDEEVVDGQTVKKMTTRYFNPIILEGLTGSIFANGDLIIGAADNVIKVQGNIYCDGNLTIRGLDLGVNLPALYKKTYNKKYIKYSTIGNKTFAGFDILGTGEYIERVTDVNPGKVNEAMYLKYTTDNGDDAFLPLQVYDEVSHYTLMDRADENDETCEFWTLDYSEKPEGVKEKVTITLREKVNGELRPVDATDSRNKKYLGATMYKSEDCNPEDMIMQYPKGGNVYCSGDIIFDRVNCGYNWVYAPKALGSNSTEYIYHDLAIYDGKGTIDASKEEDCTKVENATVSYNKTKMRGDIFCMGRMIIAPENLALTSRSTGYKDLVFTRMNGSNFNRYFDNETLKSENFFSRLKTLLGFAGNEWNKNAGNFNYDATDSYRFVYKREYILWTNALNAYNFNHSFTDNSNVDSFLLELKKFGQDNLKNVLNVLKGEFKKTINDSGYILKKGDGYLSGMGTADDVYNKFHPVEFSETSNLYIYNWDYASLIKNTEKNEGSEGQVKVQRQLNSTSLVRESRVDIDETSVSTVNDTTYKAALTVKYQPLKVNEIYVGSGNIEAVGINAFGYKSKAEVQAKKIDIIGDMISNEYQEHSLLDLIMKVNGCDEDKALKELKEKYLKIDDNIYTGYADLTYSIKDDEKGKGCVFLKYDLIALADYKCTDINDDASNITWKKTDGGEVEYLLLPRVLYRDGKFYIVDQKTGDWDPYNPENPDELDKFMEITKLSYEVIQRARKNKFKFSDGLYGIDDIELTKIATNYINNHQVIKETYEKDKYKGKGTFGFDSVEKGDTRTLAVTVGTYSFTDNLGTGTIATNKDKDEYNKSQTVLTYDDIKGVVETYANVKQLALLSNNKNNSFKAITSKEDVDNTSNEDIVHDMIKADNKTNVGESAFLSVRAFSDKGHGMYLRSSNARYANADNKSSVSAVFREIIDEGFAKIAIFKSTKLTAEFMREQIDEKKTIKVNEYNQVNDIQDTSMNPLRELKQDYLILKELYEGSKKISIDELNNMWANDDPKGRTNFYDIKNLANMNGLVEFLGIEISWKEKNINNVWTYIRHRLTKIGSDNKFYAIYNGNEPDTSVRVLQFTNGGNSELSLTCDNTFGLDPLYCTYDDKGNPIGGNQGGVFTNIKGKMTGIRTQVDYTISEDTYFNFGGEGTGGIDTSKQGPVIFGASKDDGVIDSINLLNNTKRMNITIDATKKDVYVYINAPSRYKEVEDGEKGSYVKNGDGYTFVGEGKGDYVRQAGIEFRKCSWRVKGTHNAYIMLVGDTSIDANAYKLSVNIGGGINDDSADRSDSMLGTHFYSGFYTTYSGSYTMDGENESSLKLAAKEINTVESGNLCIIGTMDNQLLLGRGGYINGFVYLPNGKYVNNSTGFLGILPNAYSNNNQATIVAKDISVKGSNIGNLVFQAFDVSSSAGGAGSDIDIDYIESNEKITYTKWNFGGYYYG